MDDKFASGLVKIFITIFILAITVIIATGAAAIVNRLLLWGFPIYGC